MRPSHRFHFCPPAAVCRGFRLAGWCLLLAAAGCSRRSPAPPEAAANVPGGAAVRRLGNVHVIGTGGRFVLVQATVPSAAVGLTDGQVLVCRAAGVDTGTLRVSHERRPPFVAADVAGGEPHVGDEVFVVPVSEATARPTGSPTPAAPSLFRSDPAPPAS